MKRRNYFWAFCAFALLVVLASCPIEYPMGPQVATPSIQADPNRSFGNTTDARISITLTSTTPGASIYFTLDGSVPSAVDGTPYTGPFYLPSGTGMAFRGHIILRAIGVRENHPDSVIASRAFQIFPREAISGAAFRTGTGIGYQGGEVGVMLTLADGFITTVIFDNVGGIQSPGYWELASDHARDFLLAMNCWDFIPVSGATYTGEAIRQAARQAIQGTP
ncbi:MAG: chitobiase/beta-hexosaminidase C-terminal domain-containing protein [Treponema sp.]|nr:chitobiase/beta-hexosaminidase C-terminal domain-containing protein [Treponema sp.]